MGLSVYLTRKKWISYDAGQTLHEEEESVFSGGTTHNLTRMADECGIYEALWRPHKLKDGYSIPEDDHDAEWAFELKNITLAREIIPLLERGVVYLKSKPQYFQTFNSPNGWGRYEHFVSFVEKYLNACKEYPESKVVVDR